MKLRGSVQDPLWYKDAIIYETHVKSFFDNNNDGIGDFPGLIQKLDYLQELGVTCLWLLPFFPSPLRDDGYDISDYTNVHPSYGTLDDFKAFLKAAHERHLQVLIELVVNHTSDQHPWFQAARQAPPGSPEREFYVWSDTDQKYRGARIIFTDTEKSNWAWDPVAKAYYWHRFFSHQPDLNYDNPAVLGEVLKIMRFWLDLGVDILRLDAIPYLVEREGTNCENLPESHAIIKQIRRELDEHYTHRALLAEANQWPTDVRPYFGDGDECHLAFHFPLMPRIFMALRLEDRHPITEIMGQTPEIPENCQWALFLRNHDELTLEMVTDEERDYMYLAYSADPAMRLNLGIRRRLAPLVDNSRRRIELLNSLLFSLPGTPVIYYGDEIGMGDNITLGDRNGVRTPMQWSADRNAGFSRANPANLYSPLIMDPVYGYEAVNVEAEQNDPSSLLHWMRNMIALRKLFKVFGRGTVEFLHPSNRKVLAYLRRYRDDLVLCVANISRFAQPVELDLSDLAGMVPVEMLGYTEFPAIGRSLYPLTLGPYGSYWFELQGAPSPLEVRGAGERVEEMAEPVALLEVKDGWTDLLEGSGRDLLETKILPEYVSGQRWFGEKTRTIAGTRIADWAPLTDQASPSALIIVEVRYAEGGSESYFLPIRIAKGAEAVTAQETHPASIICRLIESGEPGILHDATFNEQSCQALLAAMEQRLELATKSGVIRAFPTRAFASVYGPRESPLKVARGTGEQSNTSIRYGDRLILKLFRRLKPGPNPDFEVSRFLTEQVGFERIPKLAGAIEYAPRGGEPTTLGILQALVWNQGDGWSWTLEELRRYFERCSTLQSGPQSDLLRRDETVFEASEREIPQAAREAIGISLDAATTLGRRTGEMHVALASGHADPAFTSERLTSEDLERLSGHLREHAKSAFDDLKQNLSRLPDECVDLAGLVLACRRQLIDRFRRLERMPAGGLRIRIHGDYHLGQVLCVENDYVILDFEGEPARPLSERRSKQSPLKDVAGMLRSFGYAAHAGLVSYITRGPEEYERLEGWAAIWERWTAVAFLKAYRESAAEAPFLSSEKLHVQMLLDAFVLDKALYELRYELNNRPAWVLIPLRGILALAHQD